jgi:hypothetical protein
MHWKNSTFNEVDYTFILDDAGLKVIDRTIDMMDGEVVVFVAPKSGTSNEIKQNIRKSGYMLPVVTVDYTFPTNVNTVERMMSKLPYLIRYLNEPTPGVPLKEYFSPFSPLSYQELQEQKRIQDPNNMFVTRFNLADQ